MVKISLAVIIFITGSSNAQAFSFQRKMIPFRKMTLCKHGDNRCLGNHSLYTQQRSDTVNMPKMEHRTEMNQHTKSIAYISLLLAIKPSVATASDIITSQTTSLWLIVFRNGKIYVES